ncbi:hypothetical protein SDC9_181784 [bioreactor metagenome]|uniref:Uncharacterized protein n=1 Tax=bioreactor metagenome TaxID=1076179 RepID=A0A645H5I2_9ZZZZ
MGGLVTFIRRELARFDLAGRLSLVDINLIGKRFGIGFIGQRLPRYFHKIRVAQILRAVGVGIFLRFSHYLHGISAAKPVLLHIEVFENIEDLYDVNTARGRRWHGEDLISAIVAANRRTIHGFIAG